MRFYVYNESTGGARWNLRADDEQIVASSVESFGTSATAERAAEDFKDQADTCGANAGFASEYQATLAYKHVRDHAGSADGPETDSTPSHLVVDH